MAFVVHERWPVADRRPLLVRGLPPSASADGHWPRLTRPAALAATALVHAVLALLIVLRLFSSPEQPLGRSTASALTIFNLGEGERTPAPAKARAPAKNEPEKADQVTPPVAPEWKAAIVRIPQSNAPATSSIPSQPATQPAATAGGATGGGYDPYAGASPNRPGEAARSMPVSGAPMGMETMPIVVNGDMLRAFIQAFKQRHPKVRGMALVQADLTPDGRVARVIAISGSLGPGEREQLTEDIQGEFVTQPIGGASQRRASLGPMVF